jgi:hypothetical protein
VHAQIDKVPDALAEHHGVRTEGPGCFGIDVLARSNPTIINGNTNTTEEVTRPALTA